MSDLVVATWNWDAFMRGFMASGGSVLIVVIAFGLVGAIASVVGLVRGVSNRQTTAIALGGVGIGCAIIGLLFFPLGLWTASAVCGLMACKRSKQPRMLSYEEFKQRKAMMQDPEYAEYMRTMHGIEDTGGMTAEQILAKHHVLRIPLHVLVIRFARIGNGEHQQYLSFLDRSDNA